MDTVVNSPDPAFPRFHARPAKGWISDPCGLTYAGGRYHVFFQFNPDSARHSGIRWGHLSSPDLVRWDEEPVALTPQPGGPDALGCWTGVVTDDDGVPTAVYSGGGSGDGRAPVLLARGSRDLTTWTQDGHVAADMPPDPQVTAVRDPFLFRFRGRRYALQGAGLGTGRAAVLLYGVDDPRNWTYEGIWFSSDHPLAAKHLPSDIWECPQLVRVPDSSGAETWLLMASLWLSGDLHEHANGVGYLLGLVVPGIAGLPVFTPEAGGRADLGREFYAPQILALPERTLLWGWAPEAAGSEGRPGRSRADTDDAGWAGILTLPRELSVHGGTLAVEPAAELQAYRGTRLYAGAAGTLPLPRYAEARVTGGEGRIRLTLRSTRHTVGIQRTVATQRTVLTEEVAGGDEFRIFLDASIVEAYRHRSVPTTVRVYPEAGEVWQLELPHGASADAWELRHPEPT
ncbi:glycoside hydrolase family 32 protein [Arthrobacter sp. B3I9]|uniref:glycoside hydrolase family 32 protein n=1 Tax=Arthrobacter sp. B3I9 TaxID=3042270 RepID=UPI0027D89EC1|nr:glycoside hydrolase family 32 protein [Arthrobacter sp. B3I9]